MKRTQPFTLKQLNSLGYIEYEPDKFAHCSRAEVAPKQKPRKSKQKHIKTGDINDTRNIANKEKQVDAFIQLVKQELNLETWPEFFFTTERSYRLDYAIPEYKIGIEQEGGIHLGYRGGHSKPAGIKKDMEKASCLAANGWVLIRRIPKELCTNETLELIKQAITNKG